MENVFASWESSFAVDLLSGCIQGIGTGFLLMVVFFIVGAVVNLMMDVMRGGFFWR